MAIRARSEHQAYTEETSSFTDQEGRKKDDMYTVGRKKFLSKVFFCWGWERREVGGIVIC